MSFENGARIVKAVNAEQRRDLDKIEAGLTLDQRQAVEEYKERGGVTHDFTGGLTVEGLGGRVDFVNGVPIDRTQLAGVRLPETVQVSGLGLVQRLGRDMNYALNTGTDEQITGIPPIDRLLGALDRFINNE